ncbi:MAG: RluA family pseudouridine synthase [Lactobacillales bacterium]|jgi:23S rRNA pseudouridine1911/1915/1917 synthase|nr:RluA family pseudouridine synthase [Lactobacillales bacterium]
MENINFVITDEIGRIDKILAERLENSRSQIQSWLKNGQVKVNGVIIKPNYKVVANNKVEVTLPEMTTLNVQPENLPLDVVYEDHDVVVVNKSQGMVVHPSAGHATGTLVNALLYHIDNLSSINGVTRPGIVHRIDKDTSGLLMIAKNDMAHQALAEQLKNHTSLRKYVALVHGNFSHNAGKIEAPIARSKEDRKKQAVVANGKSAITYFKVLERFGDYTLVELQLETGRTHQIRVHMAYIGHPIAGDPIYGLRKTLKGSGQFLHAQVLGFKHPKTGQFLSFTAPLPDVFEKILSKLRKNNINEL